MVVAVVTAVVARAADAASDNLTSPAVVGDPAMAGASLGAGLPALSGATWEFNPYYLEAESPWESLKCC